MPSLLSFVGALVCLVTPVIALPPGFLVEPVAHFRSITDISILPTSGANNTSASLLVTSKTGEIHFWDGPSSSSVVMANLEDRLCLNGERGIGAALAHPLFEQHRFIYVYYTYNRGNPECLESPIDGPVNRCSRFAVHRNNWTLDLSSEQVLLQTPPLAKRTHNAGSMVFGRDGGGDDYHLYVTIGDAGTPVRERISQNTSNVLGTLVRLTPEGDIPSTNPFAETGERCNALGYTATAPCQEVFAWGLRNPFKMAADPNALDSTRLLINDVGSASWEETSVGGSEYVGANYGYPFREGPCSGFGNGGNNVVSCEPESTYQDPWHFYNHRDKTDLGGGCITSGAMVPQGYWPAEFDNAYFFADFVFGEMYCTFSKFCAAWSSDSLHHLFTIIVGLDLKPNADGGCRTCEPPISAMQNVTFHSWERISSMVFAPNAADGSMSLYFASQLNGPHTLFRIVHVGGDNTAPQALVVANRTQVPVGEPVQFHGRESTDAEGSALSYEWHFGEGSPLSTGSTVTHRFTSKGVFIVTLTVEDGEGGRGSDTIAITVGSPPSDVSIESPVPGTKFAVGDVFTLQGSAVDFEGNAIPQSGLSWEVRQHHSTHWHPFLDPTSGNGISLFPAPSPEDFLAATNSHLEILLTATDSDGLSTTVSQIVLPKTVWLNFETSPPGMDLFVDAFRIETPQKILSWENHPLHAVAPSGDDTTVFLGWSDGGTSVDHLIRVTPGDADEEMRYIAQYGTTSDFGCQSISARCIVEYVTDLLFHYFGSAITGLLV